MPRKSKKNRIADFLLAIGIGIVVLSVISLLFVFSSTIKQEISYVALNASNDYEVVVSDTSFEEGISVIVAADKDFSVVIPKIGANTKVIKNVDPYNEKEYQQALTLGIAHAKGSNTPDKGGNTFLFAHSSDNFYNANKYNSVFYLMNKLVKGDEVYVIYDGEKYPYSVVETKLVAPEEISYLEAFSKDDQVTLMTCWPPGTTMKRLVVVAKLDVLQDNN